MNKLFITLALYLIGFQAFADAVEYKSDARTLFLVDAVKGNCESEFMQATSKRLKILEIVQQTDEVDGKLKIVTVMQTGFYAHPLTGPRPQVVRLLKMTQIQKEGPIPADAGPFFDTTCELK